MKNELLEEQPLQGSAGGSSLEENGQVQTSQTPAGDANLGEPIGKFKSVKDLFEAYNNLQAEFTRKSQRLSEIEKEKTNEQTDSGLKAFLSKNQEAFPFADELKKRASLEQSQDEDTFSRVWAKMLYEKLSSGKADFQNMILNDEKIKELVIKNYVKELGAQQAPYLISSGAGERVAKTAPPKPDTFEQAKKVVLDLLS